jgi:GNAT superfamily N-acetyltransferase
MTTTTEITVRPSIAADRDAICAVLAGAFADDPVFIWMIPDADRRAAVLPGLFALFADAYQPLDASQVVGGSGPAVGAALWAAPGTQAVSDDAAEEFGAGITEACGPDAGRVFEVMGLLDERHPAQACWYLNLLGVDLAHHGRGLGSALLSATLQRCDAETSPAYLEATSPRNRRLYARHGFEVVGEIALPGGPSLWPMWRAPQP